MVSRSKMDNLGRNQVINIRVQEQQRDLIDYAASILGKSRSDFMLEVACREAENVICGNTFFALDEEKYQEFLAILDSPPQADKELRKFLSTKSPWD
ncbi:type II toxin-antitoxin system TacA family antitoxin [Nostoc sp. UHCC 0870]